MPEMLKIFIVLSIGLIVVLIGIRVTMGVQRAEGGTFGIRPISHGCYGIKLKSSCVYMSLPEGSLENKFLDVGYYVPADREKWKNHDFCLGQDVWYGE